MKKVIFKLIPFTLFLVLSVFLFRGLSLDPHELPSAVVGKKIPTFTLPNINEGAANLSNKSLPRKMFLLNIWASWCEACIEEQVFLMKLAQDDIPIFGINYKDDQPSAIKWLQDWGNPYNACGMDQDGRFAIELGVYGSPETFLVNEHGQIIHRHTGILNQAIWDAEFRPLLSKKDVKA